MKCEKGSLAVRVTLAPTVPPKIESWGLRSIMPPSDEMRQAIESKLPTIPAQWGKCAIGEPFSEIVVKVTCERGDVLARVSNGNVIFAPMVNAEHPCVP